MNIDRSAITKRTSEQIGWHRHNTFWVDGLLSGDGCELCDAAQRWIDSLRDWREVASEQLRAQRGPMPKQNIDPHRPLTIDERDSPSLNKITRPKRKTKTNWSRRR